MKNIKYTATIIFFLFSTLFLKSQDRVVFKEYGIQYISSFSFHNGIESIDIPGRSLPNNLSIFSLHQVVGYLFNPHFSLGMGLGFEKWRRTSFIPIYADVRLNLLRGRYSPTMMLNLGYSSKWYESPRPDPAERVINGATEGLFFEGGIGVKVMFQEAKSVFFAVTYKMQESDIKFSDENNSGMSHLTNNQSKKVQYQFIGARVGLIF